MTRKFEILNLKFEINEGYTLVELILALSLSIIIGTVSVSGFVQFNNSQKVQSAAYDVATVLQKARSRAQTQVKPSQIAGCQSAALDAYTVHFCSVSGSGCTGSGSQRYELHVVCGGTNYITEGHEVASGVSFGAGTSATVSFQVLQGSSRNNTVVINGFGKTKTIQVSGPGIVSIQ